MARLRIEHNIGDIRKELKRNPKKMAFHLAIAIRKSAFLVERFSKKIAPVDTGRLRGSISSTIMPLIATVSPKVNYAVRVHEGTRFITGNPFMTKGARAAEFPIIRVFNKEIGKALK